MSFPGGWELFAILAVLVLLFGASKLPAMARSLGQSARVFKAETRGMKADDEAANKDSKDDPQQLGPGQSSAPQTTSEPQTTSGAENSQRNDATS